MQKSIEKENEKTSYLLDFTFCHYFYICRKKVSRFTLTEMVLSFLFEKMVYAFKNSIIKDLNKIRISQFPQTKVNLLALLIPSFL